MESGTFNYNKKIFNIIIKYSKETELSKLILKEFASNNIKTYVSDIKKCNVKTANVLFECKNLIVESYVSGKTIDQILRNNDKEKLEVLRKLLKVYNNISANDNLCLDWNLKNFIHHNGELYYIDFVPCIYKNKISQSKSEVLKDYIDSFLDNNITLQGIYYYAIKTILPNLNKEELISFRSELNNLYQEELNLQLDLNSNHPYTKCIKEIDKYIDTNMDINELESNLKKYSLEEKINENFTKKYV